MPEGDEFYSYLPPEETLPSGDCFPQNHVLELPPALPPPFIDDDFFPQAPQPPTVGDHNYVD